MIHPDTELRFIDPKIGCGVFATQFIPRGTITWVRDALDQTLSPEVVATMPQICKAEFNKYSYRDILGNYVLCWDLGRYMNHSCNPTCLGHDIDFEVAVRDIRPGEELTTDYATLNLLPDETLSCYCSSQQCRKSVAADDIANLANMWKTVMRDALQIIEEVPQPLWSLLKEQELNKAIGQINLYSSFSSLEMQRI